MNISQDVFTIDKLIYAMRNAAESGEAFSIKIPNNHAPLIASDLIRSGHDVIAGMETLVLVEHIQKSSQKEPFVNIHFGPEEAINFADSLVAGQKIRRRRN